MSPDLSPSSRCVFYLLSLYIANLSSEHYAAFLRFQEFDDPVAYSNLIVPGDIVYAGSGISNACFKAETGVARQVSRAERFFSTRDMSCAANLKGSAPQCTYGRSWQRILHQSCRLSHQAPSLGRRRRLQTHASLLFLCLLNRSYPRSRNSPFQSQAYRFWEGAPSYTSFRTSWAKQQPMSRRVYCD